MKREYFTCFRLIASKRYNPLHAALIPAASVLKPLIFKYEERSRTGGNSIGRAWKGLKCCAVTRVARRVGGNEDSIQFMLAIAQHLKKIDKGKIVLASPIPYLVQRTIFDIFFFRHCVLNCEKVAMSRTLMIPS